MNQDVRPIARFFRLIEQARPPQRADRSAMGTLPTRAYRYCEAVTSATGWGWWIFPPMDMQIMWDGTDIYWHYEGAEDWLKLMPSAQYPGFSDTFDAAAPEELRGYSPPFLTALPEPGTLQIWTGLMARTAPDWHLLLRSPPNLPGPGGICLFEGIVETDRWFGPLFANLRFTRSHTPIRLRADFPLVQAQPVRPLDYAGETLAAMSVAPQIDDLAAEDWEAYRTTIVVPNQDHDRPFGAYATKTRKQRRCPVMHAATEGGA
jgi:Family of unknown function (DUF6065)